MLLSAYCLISGCAACHYIVAMLCRMDASFATISIIMSCVWLNLVASETVALLQTFGRILDAPTVQPISCNDNLCFAQYYVCSAWQPAQSSQLAHIVILHLHCCLMEGQSHSNDSCIAVWHACMCCNLLASSPACSMCCCMSLLQGLTGSIILSGGETLPELLNFCHCY